jgi:hypothetical protein
MLMPHLRRHDPPGKLLGLKRVEIQTKFKETQSIPR